MHCSNSSADHPLTSGRANAGCFDRQLTLTNQLCSPTCIPQVRDRHFDLGALLLGLGTFAAIEGPVNTYLRAEKLFPGPHLYAGAGCVVAWAVAASLVPKMQKGNELARTAHIAINLGMIGLFGWQVRTLPPWGLFSPGRIETRSHRPADAAVATGISTPWPYAGLLVESVHVAAVSPSALGLS